MHIDIGEGCCFEADNACMLYLELGFSLIFLLYRINARFNFLIGMP